MLGFTRRICNVLKEELVSVRSRHTNMNIAPLQKSALDERCILVDENDVPVGEATKKHCHLVGKDGSIPLHRAFSVFLFNSKGDLLIQKRSSNKVTFPDHYTNTCCSHPLAEIEGESDEKDAIGIRRAAQRRLNFELGIPTEEVPLNDLFYLTRIHYKDAGEGIWGEHEIDYILFLQSKKTTVNPNPDEISEIQWVPRKGINDFVKKIDSPLTPWFKLILENQLILWWDNLNSLDKYKDHKNIHFFSKT